MPNNALKLFSRKSTYVYVHNHIPLLGENCSIVTIVFSLKLAFSVDIWLSDFSKIYHMCLQFFEQSIFGTLLAANVIVFIIFYVKNLVFS